MGALSAEKGGNCDRGDQIECCIFPFLSTPLFLNDPCIETVSANMKFLCNIFLAMPCDVYHQLRQFQVLQKLVIASLIILINTDNLIFNIQKIFLPEVLGYLLHISSSPKIYSLFEYDLSHFSYYISSKYLWYTLRCFHKKTPPHNNVVNEAGWQEL